MKKIKAMFKNAKQALVKRNAMVVAAVATITAALLPNLASAIPVPAAGSFAYDVYDVVVVQVLQGPIGFVGGLATIVFGASQLMKSWMVAVLAIVAGTVIIKADTITASLGAVTSAL